MHALLNALLQVPAPVIMAVVFALPALEASTLLGVFVPGETVLLLGGVLAFNGRVSLVAALAAGALGAVIGDSVGYWIGVRWGDRIIAGRLGRMIGKHRWQRARRYLSRKGFLATVVGRFPPVARTLVPILAGSARMRYRRFLAANVVGGVVWAVASVLVGYFAGDAWRRVERVQNVVGLVAVASVLVAVVVLKLRARARPAGARARS